MLTAEQILIAHKSNVEILFGLGSKAFEGVEKIVELNLQTAKAAMSEVADTTRAVEWERSSIIKSGYLPSSSQTTQNSRGR